MTETYTFDFYYRTTKAARRLRFFWDSALVLYASLHKLAMLNDLAIPKRTRDRFRKDTLARRFASRLPEPQDEDKVFRFEQVRFKASSERTDAVDYVSLSDGEHQRSQWLGTLAMQSLSEESSFCWTNPSLTSILKWRVKAISRMLDLPTANGKRSDVEAGYHRLLNRNAYLTTHAPFVPSDMPRDRVLIFSKPRGR